MDIKFKNKPTQKLLMNYCKKIEKFLSAHKLSITIEIFNTPGRIESFMNGNLTEVENCWLGKCVITSQTTGEFEIKLPRIGIDENLTNQDIWNDACSIQNQIYGHLKLSPNPANQEDPYWNLWSYYR